MPGRPTTICTYPGCNTLVRDAIRRCERHRSAGKWADKARGTSSERGYGWEWQKLREQILRRDMYLCQICLAMVPSRITVGNEVDHIISKAKGGSDAMENLQTACHACHLAKTAAEKGAEPRQRQRIGVDGYPIDER